ncbi:uncharacterized protein C8Q71DRAFT_736018 [Rhodofomes roseus]|uniref:Uncharacterized protein n=1 Tax=Rhodofomes roseus TaxID=34475 RepID=A0A4Y9YJI5_9APHY|nr:uncharacterized protein C8Q71DRAFT_736018 [Rhodofomes roseus]KAH9843131.1 hypothetical protein C8Q71DRAFT_736018 [Rhodofomes roseus]TFY62706.1 hypothetical protein EVJ58_g3702 [Rhodofomes roseus]
MLPFTVILSAVVYARYASALTSLYIPGFDPQPVTANLLGSQDGVTSYVIAPGVSSAGMDDYGIEGPATLVVGPNTAGVTYIDEGVGLAMYESCNIQDGISVCEDVVIAMGSDGLTMTQTVTETVAPFAVQGGAAVTGAAAISTSPVPTGDFATWTPEFGDFPTDSSDDGFPAPTGSSQAAGNTPTPTPAPSGMSKVAASGGAATSDASGSAGNAQTTSTTSGATHLHLSSLLAVVVAGITGALVVLA